MVLFVCVSTKDGDITVHGGRRDLIALGVSLSRLARMTRLYLAGVFFEYGVVRET